MRIAQLELKNIGVFDHQIFEFEPNTEEENAEIHILTGVNGSGKSTVLYALASIFDAGSVVSRFRYRDRRSQLQTVWSDQFIFKLSYDQRKGLFSVSEPETTSYLQSQQNIFQSEDRMAYIAMNWNFSAFAYSGSRSIYSSPVLSIQELSINPFEDALNFQKVANSQAILQWVANTKVKTAFALQDNDPGKADRFRSSLQRIETAIQDMIGHDFEFVFHYEPLSVAARVNGEELAFDVLPDGLKSIVSWIADLLMRLDRIMWADDADVLERNFVLLLDEIEIHLHPAWQRSLLPVIQKLFKHAQIFVVTHSPFVVGSINDAWVHQLALIDGHAKVTSVQPSKAGFSYATVLDEVFGIKEYFDIATEHELKAFDKLKRDVLQGHHGRIPDLIDLSTRLSKKSVEVQAIIGRELRQLERITGQTIAP